MNMKKMNAVGADTFAPVVNATEIEKKQGTGPNQPLAGKVGNTHVDDGLRELAGNIKDYAEANRSSDPGWSKVKSAADAVHNGVKTDIAKLIRELREIGDPEAQGFSVELTLALEGKKTEALKTGHVSESGKVTHALPETVVAQSAAGGDNSGVDDKPGDSDAQRDAGNNEEEPAQPAGGNGVGRAVVKPGTDTGHAAAAENLTPPAPKPLGKNKAAGKATTVSQGEQTKESGTDVTGKSDAYHFAPGITAPQCSREDIGKLQPHPRAKGKFKIDDKEFTALKANMSEIGFDPRHPVIVVSDGKGGYQVVDGMSRMRAALELGISEIFIMVVEFGSYEELDYFIATTQMLRRERTDAVLMTVAALIIPIEERRAKARQGARNELATSTHKKAEVNISTSDAVGVILQCSGSTVDKLKKILANPEYSRKVMTSDIKIAAAYREIMNARRPPKPVKTDKPAADASADIGTECPVDCEPAEEDTGETMALTGGDPTVTVVDDVRDVVEKVVDAPDATKAPVADAVPNIQSADNVQAGPAIQGDTPPLYPATGKLLSGLLGLAPVGSTQKIYGLLTGCPQKTRDLIKKHLSGIEEPSLRKTQGHPSPKDKLILNTSGKCKSRAKDGAAGGKKAPVGRAKGAGALPWGELQPEFGM